MKMKEFFDNNPESIPYLERLEEEWINFYKINNFTVCNLQLQITNPRHEVQ